MQVAVSELLCTHFQRLAFLQDLLVTIARFPGVQGFHKILKKHDKQLPHAPCMQFYVSNLHQQPWVQVLADDPVEP